MEEKYNEAINVLLNRCVIISLQYIAMYCNFFFIKGIESYKGVYIGEQDKSFKRIELLFGIVVELSH